MIPDAYLVAKDLGTLKPQVGLHTKPKAMVMKGSVRVDASVQVCGECGAVELVADDPQALWEAHLIRLTEG